MTRTVLINNLASTSKAPLHALIAQWDLTSEEANMLRRLRVKKGL